MAAGPLPDENPVHDTLLLPEVEPSERTDLSVLEIGRHLQEAGRAAEALALFGEPGTTAREAMTDLVTALRHLADRDRLSWSEASGWAETHYYDRTRGEGDHPPVAVRMTGLRVVPDLVLHHRPAETVRRENAKRADRAARAVRKYYGGPERAEIGQDIITDLLTGMRHLADLLPDVSWSAVTDTAEHHYHAEIRGEP